MCTSPRAHCNQALCGDKLYAHTDAHADAHADASTHQRVQPCRGVAGVRRKGAPHRHRHHRPHAGLQRRRHAAAQQLHALQRVNGHRGVGRRPGRRGGHAVAVGRRPARAGLEGEQVPAWVRGRSAVRARAVSGLSDRFVTARACEDSRDRGAGLHGAQSAARPVAWPALRNIRHA